MKHHTRRTFIKTSLVTSAACTLQVHTCLFAAETAGDPPHKPGGLMKLGLCTYLWGQDWDVPTLLANCKKTGFKGIELRVEHAHKVSAKLTPAERKTVRKQFEEGKIKFLGMGCNWDFHHTDAAKLKASIEGAQADIRLGYDLGGTGIKVKPNALPKEVSVAQTCRQIGESLNILGKYAAPMKQEVRVEVHGSGTSELPVMKQIFDHATEPNVTICWNCNAEDLKGEGLEHNFNLVKKRLGTTVHVRELNVGDYPYQQLIDLFVAMDYKGWILLEARTKPEDRIAAMIEQREVFEKMVKNAQEKLKA